MSIMSPPMSIHHTPKKVLDMVPRSRRQTYIVLWWPSFGSFPHPILMKDAMPIAHMITTRKPRIIGRVKKSLIADLGLSADIVLDEEG